MAEEIKTVDQTRRSAIKTAAQVAVTAPAVGLLLSGSAKAAAVSIHYGDDSRIHRFDDNPPSDDPTSFSGTTGDDFYTY